MNDTRRTRPPTVLVVGAGAAGSLVALHLVRTAGRRGTGVEIAILDPADHWARGVAFGTSDDGHLLNVPAQSMSAFPEDPAHFVAWRDNEAAGPKTDPYTFAPRREFARYLDETLREAIAASGGGARVSHHRTKAVAARRDAHGMVVETSDGRAFAADAVVVATGLPTTGDSWAPPSLRGSAFFVPDPWAPGALDVVRRDRAAAADVLVVGTGLTMVDVVISLSDPANRPDRVIHAISRGGRLPAQHAVAAKLAAIPDTSSWSVALDDLRAHVARHVAGVEAATGDWRPAIDGLRFQVAAIWARMSEEDRLAYLANDASRWNRVRHRMPRQSALLIAELQAAGRLDVASATVLGAEPLPTGGLRVQLSDDTTRDVGWVVNGTGPRLDVRALGDRFLDDLVRPRAGAALATVSTAGMGFQTRDGRLLDSEGTTDAPLWTLGALRRGELWESTAVPEIRTQALAVAQSVLNAVAPLPRKLADGRTVSGHHPIARPRDPLGLPLSTTAEAAASFNAGLERIMRLQDGAENLLREATVLDPDFALAHAALAMLGHEAGAEADVVLSIEAAKRAVRTRGDDRERSLVDVVNRRVRDVRRSGAQALMSHIASYPRDVLAVSAAVPTIAFSGVVDIQQEAWDLVEGLAPVYGDHWWYISLLAFTRQDQSRFEEAGFLAESALSCEPSSGHAVHAQAHVMYETGQHEAGRTWLDHWVSESGQSASHAAHFAWHAALHDLALGDTEAVRRRYYSQLAPPAVTGVRSLVDSASLLWRWRMAITGWDTAFPDEQAPPPVAGVLDSLDPELLTRPQTPFVALHAAIALAAGRDIEGLATLRRYCSASRDPLLRRVVAPVCDALRAVDDSAWELASELLDDVMPDLVRVGGSAAQREVIEETLLFCLLEAGEFARARGLLDERLVRRPYPVDSQRRLALVDR